MSGMDARVSAKEKQQMLEDRYQAARANIDRRRQIEDGQSGALLFAAMAYGDALERNKLLKLASHWAKLFCIAAVFVIPNLLVLRVLL